MQDQSNAVLGPAAIDAIVADARQERAQALTLLLLGLPQAFARLLQRFRPSRLAVKANGKCT